MQLNLDPTERNLPGEALLCIRKWAGSVTHLKLTIQRNQDGHYLQADGGWNAPPYWFVIDQLDTQADRLSVAVGPQVVDPLLAISATASFKVQLQDATGHQEETILRCARTLLGSSASGETVSTYAFGRLQTPAPSEPPPVEPAPVIIDPPEPPPPPPPPKGRRSLLPLIAILVLLALIAAGAYWWWSQREAAEPPSPPTETTAPADTAPEPAAPEPAAPEPAAPAPAAPAAAAPAAAPTAPCDLTGYQPKDELTFVKACASSSAGTEALLQTIAQAKAAGYCGVAQRLYANRGQAGDSRIALAYAHEYDPKFHQDNDCFKTADPDIAIYWYETVLTQEPGHTEAQARLKELAP